MMQLKQWVIAVAIAAGAVARLPDAQAAIRFETSELVATTQELQEFVPPSHAFTVAVAGSYEFTLADPGFPVPLKTLRAIVARGGVVVAEVTVSPGDEGSDTFSAEPGDYRVLVLGEVEGAAVGSYSIRVAPLGAGPALVEETGSISGSTSPPADTTFVEFVSIDVGAVGTYQLVLTDHQFPAALQSLNAIVLRDGVPVTLDTSTSPATFTASQTGTYDVVVDARLVTAGSSGLYGLTVQAAPGGAVVHQSIHEAGQLPNPATVSLPAAGQYTLATSDLQFPQSLSSFRTLLVQGSRVLMNQADSATSPAFAAAAGDVKLYLRIQQTGAVGVGVVGVRILSNGSAVYAATLLGDIDPNPATPSIYAITASALAAGNYSVTLEDFGFPEPLTSLRVAVAQADALVDDWIGEGQRTFAATAGAARLIVAAAPANASANGLFGLRLTTAAGTTLVETNQGVGGLFRANTFDVAAEGTFDIRLADLQFPAQLSMAALAVTRGTELVGQVYGGGLLRTQLQPGTYRLNFVAKPAPAESHGAYSLEVVDSPPVPTLVFSGAPASVSAGQTTTLQWQAANATSCSASGAWSGAQAVQGSFVTAAITAPSTFELSCDGPGGSVSRSVTVAIAAPTSGKKGGGGALNEWGLLLLLAAGAIRGKYIADARCNGFRSR